MAHIVWNPSASRGGDSGCVNAMRGQRRLTPHTHTHTQPPQARVYIYMLDALLRPALQLWVLGAGNWERWHGGAVGCVACVPERLQVLSGSADKRVRLWGAEVRVRACMHGAVEGGTGQS